MHACRFSSQPHMALKHGRSDPAHFLPITTIVYDNAADSVSPKSAWKACRRALVKRVTQSELLGLLVLGFLASDLVHVLWYGLNALRAWHFLAIFGLIYHVFDWTKVWTGGAPPLRQTALVVLFTLIAFGVGYDFWIILSLNSLQCVARYWSC